MFLVHSNSDSAKREKVCHLRIGIYIWNYYDYGLTYIKKVSTGMVDEKLTVISSVVHTYIPRPSWKLRWDQCYFFVTEAGNALAALGNIHECDSHISNKTGTRLIIYSDCHLV